MTTESKNIIILHATDFQSKATAAYLLWVYRKLLGVPRDNIMLYSVKEPNRYALPFEESIIQDQRFYFIGCAIHPCLKDKDVYKNSFYSPIAVYNLFTSFPTNAKHTYPDILSKMFGSDTSLYYLSDEALEAFRPYMDDMEDDSDSPWEHIRKKASYRIQHLNPDEENLSTAENAERTASIIMEEIMSYLAENGSDDEIMKRIECYPWYDHYLKIMAPDTPESAKHMLRLQLFPLMFTTSRLVWNSMTEKQKEEKFRTQFYAGTTIYNTDVDHAQFWFTLFDECQIITEKVDADGKTITTADEPIAPIPLVLLKEKDTDGDLMCDNLVRPARYVSLFNLIDTDAFADKTIVLDEPIRLKSVYFVKGDSDVDPLIKIELKDSNTYILSKEAIDSGDRTLFYKFDGWATSTNVSMEEVEGSIPFSFSVTSELSTKTGSVFTLFMRESECADIAEPWNVVAYEIEATISNGIRNMVKEPDLSDPRLLVNQVFQAGCAILEHTESKERYISRTCAFPLQITLDDKILTMMALNTPPARPEIMQAVMEDVFDGYVQFAQISKEVFVLNIDICIPAKSVFSEGTDYVEKMEVYLNNLAIKDTLNVKIKPTSDSKHDHFTGSLLVLRGTWNRVLNASDIDKKDVTVPTE